MAVAEANPGRMRKFCWLRFSEAGCPELKRRVERQYDELIKFATALRLGIARANHIGPKTSVKAFR
jgi:hypothetical protein